MVKYKNNIEETEFSLIGCCSFVYSNPDIDYLKVKILQSNERVLSVLSDNNYPFSVIEKTARKLLVKISKELYKSSSHYYSAFSFLRWAANTHDGNEKLDSFFYYYDLGEDWITASYLALIETGDSGYYWSFNINTPPWAVHDFYRKFDGDDGRYNQNTYRGAEKVGTLLLSEIQKMGISRKELTNNLDKIKKLISDYKQYCIVERDFKVGEVVSFKVDKNILRQYSIYTDKPLKITKLSEDFVYFGDLALPKSFIK
jgi:hypothetical protein